jgi:hypothetical protein
MIRHDLSHWPLVLSTMTGASTPDEQRAFFSEWTTWLDRGVPFATLRVFQDDASLERPSGGAKEAKLWLQENGGKIKEHVIGMASVVPPARLDEMSRMNAEKLFGVPAQTFAAIEPAVDWIAARLADKGIKADTAIAGKTLKRLLV